MNNDNNDSIKHVLFSQIELITFVFIGISFILITIITIIAFFYHINKHGSDRPNYLSLFFYIIRMIDFITDLIWKLSLATDSNLMLPAIFITIFSHILSAVIGITFIIKWRHEKFIMNYFQQYDKFIFAITFFGGFYAAINVSSSHLFHLNIFSMPLMRIDIYRLNNFKLFNEVLLENIPLLILQSMYLFQSGGTPYLTLIAMLFSFISSIIGSITLISRLIDCICILYTDYCLSKNDNGYQKAIIKYSTDKTKTIEYEIEIISKNIKKYHKHSNKLLSLPISKALHLHISQIEILNIFNISDGIHIVIHFIAFDNKEINIIIKQIKTISNNNQCNEYQSLIKELMLNLRLFQYKKIKIKIVVLLLK